VISEVRLLQTHPTRGDDTFREPIPRRSVQVSEGAV
jgi:hypothetical protein